MKIGDKIKGKAGFVIERIEEEIKEEGLLW